MCGPDQRDRFSRDGAVSRRSERGERARCRFAVMLPWRSICRYVARAIIRSRNSAAPRRTGVPGGGLNRVPAVSSRDSSAPTPRQNDQLDRHEHVGAVSR